MVNLKHKGKDYYSQYFLEYLLRICHNWWAGNYSALLIYELTLHYMGGWIPTPLQFSVPGAFQSDLRGSKFWFNSLLVLTMQVINFENLKGVPKKIWSMFFEAGVKNQKFKVGPIGLKFSGVL